MGRILGIDMGERRIGVAISTPERTLAVPMRIIDAAGDDADAMAISTLAGAEGVDAIVVGHPVSLDGSTGPQARRVEAFARRLAKVGGLPVKLWDERLTSVQAGRPPPPAGGRSSRKSRRPGPPSDDVAAGIMLQSYLDHLAALQR